MSGMKITGKLSSFLPAISSPCARIFATSATTPLQYSKKETLERTAKVADAVKGGARGVRVATDKVKDIASNTSDSVTKMSKDVTSKVSKTSDEVTANTKNKMSGVVDTAKTATEFAKAKVSK